MISSRRHTYICIYLDAYVFNKKEKKKKRERGTFLVLEQVVYRMLLIYQFNRPLMIDMVMVCIYGDHRPIGTGRGLAVECALRDRLRTTVSEIIKDHGVTRLGHGYLAVSTSAVLSPSALIERHDS